MEQVCNHDKRLMIKILFSVSESDLLVILKKVLFAALYLKASVTQKANHDLDYRDCDNARDT